LLVLLAITCVTPLLGDSGALDTSMVQLLANPSDFHGKFVRVSGYLHNQFEDTALYLSKEDADFLNGKQSVWIEFGDEIDKDPNKPLEYFDCKRVLIEGIFDKNMGGHMGLSSAGGIRNISRILEETRWFDGKKHLQKETGSPGERLKR
jgi:hypothetical protein